MWTKAYKNNVHLLPKELDVGFRARVCCRLHCWLRSGPRTQRMSLPLSTLRSSSPCASWAAPLSGVCAGSATGFPRTAPTCLRAVGVAALPCPGGQVACGGRQHSSPSRIEDWSWTCAALVIFRCVGELLEKLFPFSLRPSIRLLKEISLAEGYLAGPQPYTFFCVLGTAVQRQITK